MKLIDLTGKSFGDLTVIARAPSARESSWMCECACGRQIVVRAGNLKSGNSKSCGCRRPDVARGWAGTPEYTAFRNALNRCNRESDSRYHLYGGRGIEFRFSDMSQFIAAVGPRPSGSHSLDRVDPNGHYETGNVRWATATEQAVNKQKTLTFEIDGVRKPLRHWAEEYGQPYKRVWERLKSGWTLEEALNRRSQIADTRVIKLWGDRDETVVVVEAMA
ncbi:MAG: hypothetical protein ACLGIP_16680 [Alphaproteobacteria bacterium]